MKKNNLYSYIFKNPKLMFGLFLLILLASVFAQLTPYIQGLLVDNAVLSQNEQALLSLCLIFAVILVLDCFSKYYLSILTTNFGFTIAKEIRRDVFAKTINRPYDFFELKHNGDILQRTNSFIYTIGKFLSNSVSDFVIGIARFLIIFTFMFVLNYQLALVLAGLYLAILVIIFIFSHYIFSLGKKYKKYELHRNSLILQNLEGLETYLAYNDNFDYLKNYKKVNKEYDRIRGKYYWLYNSFYPLIDFLACLGTVLIYHLAFSSSLSLLDIGVVVAMLSYASRVISPMQMISTGLAKLFETKAIVDKVFDLATEKPTNEKQLQINFEQVNIRLNSVCFESELKTSKIENLSLNIPFGEKICLFGKSGSGKTSLSHLLTGLYKATSGNIYFNEININSLSKTSINNLISVAEDDVGIFDGSIYQNVRFGNRSASKKEIKNAIKASGLLPFVNSFPQKEHARITETTISEGDKQLIAFARIILKNSPVIIIDEFTRDLGERQKNRFLKNLEKFTQNKTLIYISHGENVKFPFTKKYKFTNLMDKK